MDGLGHEWMTHKFNNADVTACINCLCDQKSPQASQACPGGSANPSPEKIVSSKPVRNGDYRAIMDSLDSEKIGQRIIELESEIAALKVLLKAAKAKETVAKFKVVIA